MDVHAFRARGSARGATFRRNPRVFAGLPISAILSDQTEIKERATFQMRKLWEGWGRSLRRSGAPTTRRSPHLIASALLMRAPRTASLLLARAQSLDAAVDTPHQKACLLPHLGLKQAKLSRAHTQPECQKDDFAVDVSGYRGGPNRLDALYSTACVVDGEDSHPQPEFDNSAPTRPRFRSPVHRYLHSRGARSVRRVQVIAPTSPCEREFAVSLAALRRGRSLSGHRPFA